MFVNDLHEKRFMKIKATTKKKDIEYTSLFYIISGCEELYKRIDDIYDLQEDCLIINYTSKGKPKLRNLKLSASGEVLLDLGLQLYNGEGNKIISKIFYLLDEEDKILAINSLKYRFLNN